MQELVRRHGPQLALYCALVITCGLDGACVIEAESCELETNAISMYATVTDTPMGVQVEIELSAAVPGDPGDPAGSDEGASLALCAGSETLEVNGQPAELVQVLDQLYYTVEFPSPEPSYEIALIRDNHDDAIARIDMPPGFGIDAPMEGSLHSRADPLEVLWGPPWPGEMIELAIEDEIGSSCIDGLGVQYMVDDTGSYMVAGGSLVGGDIPEPCDVWIALTRFATGEYPPELHPSGEITGQVKRRHRFRSGP